MCHSMPSPTADVSMLLVDVAHVGQKSEQALQPAAFVGVGFHKIAEGTVFPDKCFCLLHILNVWITLIGNKVFLQAGVCLGTHQVIGVQAAAQLFRAADVERFTRVLEEDDIHARFILGQH